MAAPAFKTQSRKTERVGYGGSGPLYRSAVQTNNRRRVSDLNSDAPKIIPAKDRRELVTLSRHLFANFPVVQGVVEEMGDFAGALSMRFKGDDQEWNDTARDWLEINDDVVSVTGGSMDLLRYLTVIAVLIDGDMGYILTESAGGMPMIQPIPGHRIGNRGDERQIKGGRYDGASVRDGVIVNALGRPVAYKVLGNEPSEDRIYSGRDFHLCKLPNRVDQLRGVPLLSSGINDWQDVKLTKEFELQAQKLGAYQGLIMETEDGNAPVDLAKQLTRSAEPTVSGGAETTTPEVYNYTMGGDGAMIRFFKAGKGGIKAFQNARPSQDSVNFWKLVVREALCGIGYSYDFAVDPSGVSGAAERVVVSRINRYISKLSRFVVKPLQNRIDGYRIAKAINTDRIPHNEDWFRRAYAGGQELTADAKHQSDTDLQNIAAGLDSESHAIARHGRNWKEVIREKAEFQKFVNETADEFGVSPQELVAVNPKNPSLQAEGEDGNTMADIKSAFDAYGVGVRAGALTPQPDDEAHFRDSAGFPSMSDPVSKDWEKDDGTRRPITLTPRGGESVLPNAENEDEETDDE